MSRLRGNADMNMLDAQLRVYELLKSKPTLFEFQNQVARVSISVFKMLFSFEIFRCKDFKFQVTCRIYVIQ